MLYSCCSLITHLVSASWFSLLKVGMRLFWTSPSGMSYAWPISCCWLVPFVLFTCSLGPDSWLGFSEICLVIWHPFWVSWLPRTMFMPCLGWISSARRFASIRTTREPHLKLFCRHFWVCFVSVRFPIFKALQSCSIFRFHILQRSS